MSVKTSRLAEGFYFAFTADASLRQRVDRLARGESTRRPRLGIGIAPSHVARRLRRAVGLPERDGILVRAVEDGGPAAAAGVSEGDLIVAAGGRPVADADALHDVLARLAGEKLDLQIVRGAEELSISVDVTGGSDSPTG